MSSADLDATLASIDAATGCQQCGAALGPSPSADFCGEHCQALWSAARVGAAVDLADGEEYFAWRHWVQHDYRLRWLAGLGPDEHAEAQARHTWSNLEGWRTQGRRPDGGAVRFHGDLATVAPEDITVRFYGERHAAVYRHLDGNRWTHVGWIDRRTEETQP